MSNIVDIRTPLSTMSATDVNNIVKSVFMSKNSINIKTPNSDFMSDSLIGQMKPKYNSRLNIPTPKMSDIMATPIIGGNPNANINIPTPSYTQQQVGINVATPNSSQLDQQVVGVDVDTPGSFSITDSVKYVYDTATGTLKSNKQLTFWVFVAIILFVIAIVLSISISLVDTGIDVADASIDAVGTSTGVGYVASLFSGIGDISSEVVLEAVQVALISGVTIFLTDSSPSVKAIKIIIVILCALIDILLSAVTVVIPYGDIVETVVEIFTEIVQTLVLVSNITSII